MWLSIPKEDGAIKYTKWDDIARGSWRLNRQSERHNRVGRRRVGHDMAGSGEKRKARREKEREIEGQTNCLTSNASSLHSDLSPEAEAGG